MTPEDRRLLDEIREDLRKLDELTKRYEAVKKLNKDISDSGTTST